MNSRENSLRQAFSAVVKNGKRSWSYPHSDFRNIVRGTSSNGRALDSHSRGTGIDTPVLHSDFKTKMIIVVMATVPTGIRTLDLWITPERFKTSIYDARMNSLWLFDVKSRNFDFSFFGI